MSEERSAFYPKTVHILFAVVVATSFPLAASTMIPFESLFGLENLVSNIPLALSYMVVLLGWVGYARSTSVWRYEGTAWEFVRFVIDILILFEYFYLLQVAHQHIGDTPYVLLALAITYLVSDIAKYFDQPHEKRPQVKKRMRPTVSLIMTTLGIILLFKVLFMWIVGIIMSYMVSGQAYVDAMDNMDNMDTTPLTFGTIIFCALMAFRHRHVKWKLQEGGDKRGKRVASARVKLVRNILLKWIIVFAVMTAVGVLAWVVLDDMFWPDVIFIGGVVASIAWTCYTYVKWRRERSR